MTAEGYTHLEAELKRLKSVERPEIIRAIAAARETGLPLIVLSPVLAAMLHLPAAGYLMLALGLLLGTPVLTLLGAVGAALVLGARRGGVLIAILVLPLYIPVLIFGVLSVDAVIHAADPWPHILLLGAALLAGLAIALPAAALALRSAAE